MSLLIAEKILKDGLKLTPVPEIIAVARLPHNPVGLTYTPCLKIEFDSEEEKRRALRECKNLSGSPLAGISIRSSMSEAERKQIQNYQQMQRALVAQGIQIPFMYPSGKLRRSPAQQQQYQQQQMMASSSFPSAPTAPATSEEAATAPASSEPASSVPPIRPGARTGFTPPLWRQCLTYIF